MRTATASQLAAAVRLIGRTLDHSVATAACGRFIFPLHGDLALAVSPDSAQRIRLDALHRGRRVATMWALAGDRDRLAELARLAHDEAMTLV